MVLTKFILNGNMMNKKTEKIKEKKIVFDTSDIMIMPKLIEKGYKRSDITALFEELSSHGFGEYIKGKRGRGSSSSFNPNETCPKRFELVCRIYRDRKTEKEETEFKEETDSITKEITSSIPKLKIYNFIDKTDNQERYSIGFYDEKAFLIRSKKGGYDSIEEAVKASLDLFENASLFKSRLMTPVEQIASILRGVGFIALQMHKNIMVMN
jgi:hypothetical protein